MEQPSLAEGDDYSYRPGYVTAELSGSNGHVSTTNLCASFDWFVEEVQKIGKNINGYIWGKFVYNTKQYKFHNAEWPSVVSIATDVKNNRLGYNNCNKCNMYYMC